MGTINTRNGKLIFDFRYLGKRCREQTKLSDSVANRKRANTIIERIEAEITLGTFKYANYFPNSKRVEDFEAHITKVHRSLSATPTCREVAKTWYEETDIEWKNSHKRNDKISLDAHLIPAFGDEPVDQITKATILAFRTRISKLPGKAKDSTGSAEHINHTMTPLRQILNEAADRFEFTAPYRGIKSLKVPRTEIHPFNIQEVKTIIETVRPDFKSYYIVRFYTGVRSAEIDGLMWKYIDLDRREILIRKTLVNGEITTAKTDGSEREIHMSEPVYQALLAQKKITGKQTFVFCNKSGEPLDANNVRRRVWYPLLRHLDLKKRRPYQTRHTTATLWLAAGENPEWIARQMGHTTTEMLFKVYSRFVPNLTRRDGSAFDRLINTQFNSSNKTEQED
jgi:integrase